MVARSGAPTTLTATAPVVQSPRKLNMMRHYRSQRDVKKTRVAARLPSLSFVEGSKHATEPAVSPTEMTGGFPNPASPRTSMSSPTKSRSRASRATDALSKFFFKPYRASDLGDKSNAATTPAVSGERRFWPRRLASEKKVVPALQCTTPTATSNDLKQERHSSVQTSVIPSSDKSDAVRDPQFAGPSSAFTTKPDSRTQPGSSSKSRVKPSPSATSITTTSRQLQLTHGDGVRVPALPAASEPPFTPHFVFRSFMSELTELEKSEMLEYSEIYFFSSFGIKSRRRGGKIHSTSATSATANAAPGDSAPGSISAPQDAQTAEGSLSPSTPPSTELFNDGYDDERGDYLVLVQDHLAYRFEVLHALGAGSFGQVVCCLDHQTQQRVAVKIIRNRKRYREQSLIEVQILSQLQRSAVVNASKRDHANHSGASGSPHIIKMREYFLFRGHLCIVFELLGINLYEYLKVRFFQGLPLVNVRDIAMQLVDTLRILKMQRVIHCDLKPENILVKPAASIQGSSSFSSPATTAHASTPVEEICLIDFGSSCFETTAVFTYIQSRFYRSPEVILGFPYSTAIDMWSLGCILVELLTGHPIFAGENEIEQLACIMEVLGPPSYDFLTHSRRRRHFFDDVTASTTSDPTITTAIETTASPNSSTHSTNSEAAPASVEFHAKPFVNSRGRTRAPGTRSLANVVKSDDRQFLAFVRRCLMIDPRERMTPDQAARDPWLSTSQELT